MTVFISYNEIIMTLVQSSRRSRRVDVMLMQAHFHGDEQGVLRTTYAA